MLPLRVLPCFNQCNINLPTLIYIKLLVIKHRYIFRLIRLYIIAGKDL
jgi:hypothetical protein